MFGLGMICSSVLRIPLYILESGERGKIYLILPKDDKNVEIDSILKSGISYINNIVTKKMTTKVLSGSQYISNSYADDLNINIASGIVHLGERGKVSSKFSKKINIVTSSGSVKVFGQKADEFYVKVSSGTIKIEDSEFGNFESRCSSGSVKLESVSVRKMIRAIIKSGSIGLYNSGFNDGYFKATSGYIKLTDIAGSPSDFIINSSVRSGRIKLNDKILTGYGYKLVNELPKRTLDLHATSGYIKVNFKDN